MTSFYFRIFRFVRPYAGLILFSLLLSLLYAGANVLFLPLTRDITTEIANKNLGHFNNQIFNAIGLYAARLIMQYGQSYLMAYVARRISVDLRVYFYENVLGLSQDFHSERKLGDILTRLNSDSDKVREALTLILWEFVPGVVTFVGIVVYLCILNLKLTLFTVVTAPLFVFIVMRLARSLRSVSATVQHRSADIAHFSQETLTNVKLVQAYAMEEKEVEKFRRRNLRVLRSDMKGIRLRSISEPLISLMQFSVIAGVIWYGGYEIAHGRMTGANLVSFFAGIFLLVDPILGFSKIYTGVQQAAVSAQRLVEIIDIKPTIQNSPEAKSLIMKGDVLFEDVSFAYGQEDVLSHIRLSVSEGEMIALVGLSGAGKSTLAHLIPRFYDPSEGRFLIDGMDLRDWDLRSLRSQIGFVPQDDFLFRGSVLSNIRYGCPQASEEDVIAAAKVANAWEFIERMPRGLSTNIGDQGGKLSGGQKQRLSIARAVLNDPRILILDEATSALDSQSEKLVQDALTKLMKGRTTFVIAHRLSTVQHADKIIVLENGRIAEMGRHEELLKIGNHYSRLYRIQFQSGGLA